VRECALASALRLLGAASNRFGRWCKDWMRRHGKEAARSLDVGWADSFVVCTEIYDAVADGTREANCAHDLMPHAMCDPFVMARRTRCSGLMNAVAIACGWWGLGNFIGLTVSHDFAARAAHRRRPKRPNAARAQESSRECDDCRS